MKIVKFGAPWCGPCRVQDKILDEFIEQGYEVEKVNIDEEEERAEHFGVMSVPTTIIFDGDQEVTRFIGLVQKNKLLEVLE